MAKLDFDPKNFDADLGTFIKMALVDIPDMSISTRSVAAAEAWLVQSQNQTVKEIS